MLGGYQIIDLSGMNIALNGDAVSITDQKVLRQLLALRDHIEENYNFTKPLNKKLKPVMIRLRDKESGEKLESALWGNLSIVDDNLSFNIDAIVTASPLKVLQINVVFEKKQDDDGNDYYDIKSAKYEYKGGEDVVTVTNIKNISSAIINKLDCGDIVLKKDSSGLHAYIVSFRNATGICLTYTDASTIETQSYDKVGQNWVYNSEDKGTLPEFAQSGTIVDVLGLGEDGKLVKEARNSAVKPIYFHPITIYTIGITGVLDSILTMIIINNSSEAFTKNSLITYLKAPETKGRYLVNGAIKGDDYYLSPAYVNETNDVLYVLGVDSAGNRHTSSVNQINFETIVLNAVTFEDEVNKIN